MGLIWEISGHLSGRFSSFFGARLFCKNTPKSAFNNIYNIQFFQDTYSPNWFFPQMFQSPDPAARPSVRQPRHLKYKCRHPKYKFKLQNMSSKQKIYICPGTQNMSSKPKYEFKTKNISPDTQNTNPDTPKSRRLREEDGGVASRGGSGGQPRWRWFPTTLSLWQEPSSITRTEQISRSA